MTNLSEVLSNIDAYLKTYAVTAIKVNTDDLLFVNITFAEIEHDWPHANYTDNNPRVYPKDENQALQVALVANIHSKEIASGVYNSKNKAILITYLPSKSWVDIKDRLYGVLCHEYMHYLQDLSNSNIAKAREALTAVDERLDNFEESERLKATNVKELRKRKRLAKSELWRIYYFNTLEKCAHAGQITFELVYKALNTDEMFRPRSIKEACRRLLLPTTDFNKMVEKSDVWQMIAERIPPSLKTAYLSLIIKESRHLLSFVISTESNDPAKVPVSEITPKT